MRFVWVFVQTVIISLYSTNIFVFVVVAGCVDCVVWMKHVNILEVNLRLLAVKNIYTGVQLFHVRKWVRYFNYNLKENS